MIIMASSSVMKGEVYPDESKSGGVSKKPTTRRDAAGCSCRVTRVSWFGVRTIKFSEVLSNKRAMNLPPEWTE